MKSSPALSALPYVEASNWSRQLGEQHKKWVVLHSMEMAEALGTARHCAAYFAGQPRSNSGSSAHACIDNLETIQCVPWGSVAWHAPGANQLGIGLEHAGYARQTAEQWLDSYGLAMLERSTWLCAQLCQLFAIPVQVVDSAGLLAGTPGITTHALVSEAWPHRGAHTDPGVGFPLSHYVELVRQKMG